MRSGLRSLDSTLKLSLVEENRGAYVPLADLVIDFCRLLEAQQVLATPKEPEYFDVVRGDADAARAPLHSARTRAEPSRCAHSAQRQRVGWEAVRCWAWICSVRTASTPESAAVNAHSEGS